jgi:hypothetical protein
MAKEKKERYVVAPGCSFIGNRRAYNAGDEIDETAFSKPADFRLFISMEKPKIIPAPPEQKAPKKSAGDTDTDTEAEAAARKKLEEEVLAKGGCTIEDLKALSVEELQEILKEKN